MPMRPCRPRVKALSGISTRFIGFSTRILIYEGAAD